MSRSNNNNYFVVVELCQAYVSPLSSRCVPLSSGAGDETLRFWQVFPGPRNNDKSSSNGLLFPSSPGSVIR